MRIHPVAILVGVLLACGWGRAACADEEAATQEAFDRDLRRVRAELAGGRPTRAKTRLDALLAAHVRKPYVVARRAELKDLAKRTAFAAVYTTPKPQKFLSGKLRRYRPKTGAIKIEYTPQTAADFRPIGKAGAILFPARFRGPFTIEIQVDMYREGGQIVMLLDSPTKRDSNLYRVFTTRGNYDMGAGPEQVSPGIWRRKKDGEEWPLAEVERKHRLQNAYSFGKKYKLVFSADRGGLTLKIPFSKPLRVKKAGDEYGWLLFVIAGWSKIKIDGLIEPSWLQEKIDRDTQKARVDFERTFSFADYLPAWLITEDRVEATAPKRGTRKPLPYYPVGLKKAARERFDAELAAISGGRQREVLERRGELEAAGLPVELRGLLEALARLREHQLEASLKSLEGVLKAAPDFARAAFLRAMVLHVQGEKAEAGSALEPLLATYRPEPRQFEFVFRLLLFDGRLAGAQAVSRLAKQHGVRSPTMELLDEALVKAENGPVWVKVSEYVGPTYRIVTDLDRASAVEAGAALESMVRFYQRTLGRARSGKSRRFKVYLFGGRAGFRSYLGRVGRLWGTTGAGAAGLYSPMLKQLIVCASQRREDTLATLRHEGLHQYLDRVLPNAPLWFNEGLAVFYENTWRRMLGRLVPGQIDHEHVRRLAKYRLEHQKLMPLRELFALEPKAFYKLGEDGQLGYAHAWLVVHFLRRGGAEEKELFSALLKAFEDRSGEKATRDVFTTQVLVGFEKRLDAHLRKLEPG